MILCDDDISTHFYYTIFIQSLDRQWASRRDKIFVIQDFYYLRSLEGSIRIMNSTDCFGLIDCAICSRPEIIELSLH